jgi:hypothetical protein
MSEWVDSLWSRPKTWPYSCKSTVNKSILPEASEPGSATHSLGLEVATYSALSQGVASRNQPWPAASRSSVIVLPIVSPNALPARSVNTKLACVTPAKVLVSWDGCSKV